VAATARAKDLADDAEAKQAEAADFATKAQAAADNIDAENAEVFANLAKAAADAAQAAADAAAAAATGKGTDALAESSRASTAATAAKTSAGAAQAASDVAANSAEAATGWVDGSASIARAAAKVAAGEAAAAASSAATAAETAAKAAAQAAADAVGPNVTLAAAQAAKDSRTSALAEVQEQRTLADDGQATDSAIELVWDAAVSQAQRALTEATNALSQAQAAADAANLALSVAQDTATKAAQAAADAAAVAAEAASDAGFAVAFEIGAQSSAQSRADKAVDAIVTAISNAVQEAEEQAAEATTQAQNAENAADTAVGDLATAPAQAIIANAASDAADAAAAAAAQAIIDAAAALNLSLAEQTVEAAVAAIKAAADTAAARDNASAETQANATEALLTAQTDADNTQLAKVASIKAAADSAAQAANSAAASAEVAESQADVATVAAEDADKLEQVQIEAATKQLAQAKAAVQAAADKAAAEAADAASSSRDAETRLADATAAVNASATAQTASAAAQAAVTKAQASLVAAGTARDTAVDEAADAQTAFDSASSVASVDPETFQALKQANDRAQAALAEANTAVADAQAAVDSAVEAAATAATEAAKAAAAAATVDLTVAQNAFDDPNSTDDAAGASARADTALANAQAARDSANAQQIPNAEAATVTISFTDALDVGDTYSVTIDATTISVSVEAGNDLAAVRDALVQAINDDATAGAVVVAAAGGAGEINLTLEAGVTSFFVATAATNTDGGANANASALNITQAHTASSAEIQARADLAAGFATTAQIEAGTAEDEADAAATALAGSPRSAAARSDAQAAADAASAAAATAGGVAQVDTVTISGTVSEADAGDTYSVTVNGQTVTVTVQVADNTINDVRDRLVDAINADDNVGDVVAAASTDGTGQFTLTAENAGVGFIATASATNIAGGTDNGTASVATTTANLGGSSEVSQVDTVTIEATSGENGDTYTFTVNAVSYTYTSDGSEASLTALRDAIVTAFNQQTDDGEIGTIVTASAGDAAGEIKLTALVSGTAFTASVSAANAADGTDDNSATISTTVANLSGADDLADQAAQEAAEQAAIATTEAANAEAAAAKAQVTIQANSLSSQSQTAEDTAETKADDDDAGTLDAVQAAEEAETFAQAAATAAAAGSRAELEKDNPDETALETFKAQAATAASSSASRATSAQDAADAAAQAIVDAAQNLGLTGSTATAAAQAITTAAQAIIDSAGSSEVAKTLATDAKESIAEALAAANAAQQDADAAAESATNAQAQADVAAAAVDDLDALILLRAQAAASDINAANETAETAAKSAEASRDAAIASGDEALDFARAAMDATNSTLDSAADFETTNDTTAKDEVQAAAAVSGGSSNGAKGTVTVNSDGTVTYTPDITQYEGLSVNGSSTDTFIYAISDGGNGFTTQNGTATVTRIRDDGDLTSDDFTVAVIGHDGASAITNATGALQAIDAAIAGGANDRGTVVADAIDAVVTRLDTAIAATKQTVNLTQTGSIESDDVYTVDIDIAREDTVTITGPAEANDVFSVAVNGTAVAFTVTAGESDANDIRDAMVSAINADATVGAVVTASAGDADGAIKLVANTPGTDYTLAVAEVEAGDNNTITINNDVDNFAVQVSVTVDAETTAAALRTTLINAINTSNAGTILTATEAFSDNEIVLTADAADANTFVVSTATTDDNTAAIANTVANDTGVAQVDTVTIGDTVEAGDTFSVTVGGATVSYTAVADDLTGNAAANLDAVRDKLIDAINADLSVGPIVTAAATTAGKFTLTADAAGTAFTATTASTPAAGASLSANATGVESALTAFASGLEVASDIARTIQSAVTDAVTAATTARTNADAIDPQEVPQTATDAEADALEAAATAAKTSAANAVAQVTPAAEAASLAFAQRIAAEQASGQAVAGNEQFEQALAKAKEEQALAEAQEIANARPVADDDAAATNEDNAVTIDVLDGDTRADLGDLVGASISVGAPANGSAVLTAQIDSIDFAASFADTETMVAKINDTTFTVTSSGTTTGADMAAAMVNLINNHAVIGPLVTASSDSRSFIITGDKLGQGFITTVTEKGVDATVTTTAPKVIYTPDENFNGTDTFKYAVSNANGDFDSATVTVTVNSVNDAPEASPDFATTATDVSSVTIDGLSNDEDPDNAETTVDTLSVAKINGVAVSSGQTVTLTGGSGAEVTLNADGTFTYNPLDNFNQLRDGETATESFTYTISDGNDGANDDNTATLGNGTANVAAVAQVDTVTLGGTVEAGDTYSVTVEGTTVTYTVTGNELGLAGIRNALVDAINANSTVAGLVTAKRAADSDKILITADEAGTAFTASAAFTDNGGTTDNSASSTTTTSNTAAVAQVETVTLAGTKEAGDRYSVTVDGRTITYEVIGTEANLEAVRDALIEAINNDDTVSAKVTASANGTDKIDIIADTAGIGFTASAQAFNAGTDTETVTVTITGTNAAPIAQSLSPSADEDNAINGTLTATDVDTGDTQTFSLAPGGAPLNGTVSIDADGDFTYTPDDNFNGTDAFTYRVVDSTGASDTEVVSITINSVNDAPVTGADEAAVSATNAVTIKVLDNDADDADGEDLSILSVSGGSFGTPTIAGQSLVYTADQTAAFELPAGTTATDTVTYTVTDGVIARAATPTANQGAAAQVDTVTIEDFFFEGFVFTVGVNAVSRQDTVTLSGEVTEDDAFTITINGTDITYTVTDTDAADGTFANAVDELVALINTDATVGPDVTAVAGSSDGEIVLVSNTPGVDYTLAVSETDPDDDSAIAAANDVANAGTLSSYTVTSGDVSADDLASLRTNVVNAITSDLSGVATVAAGSAAGEITLTAVTPGTGFTTTVTSVDDSGFDVGVLEADTTTANTAPVAQVSTVTLRGTFEADDQFTAVVNGTEVTYTVTGNEANLAAIRDQMVTDINTAVGGTVTAAAGNAAGIIRITADTPGTAFTIGASTVNENAETSTETVTITVTGANSAPEVSDVARTIGEAESVTVDVLDSSISTDNDGDDLSISGVTQGAKGAVSFDADGNITYKASASATESLAAGETFDDTFEFTVTDGEGEFTTAEFTVTITGENDNPVASADTFTAFDGGGPVAVDLLANDTDVDEGDTLSIISGSVTSQLGATITESATPVKQQDTITLSGTVEDDDLFTVVITDANGNDVFVDFTVDGQATLAAVRDALVTAIQGNTAAAAIVDVAALPADGELRLTAKTAGTPFETVVDAVDGGSNDDNDIFVETTTANVEADAITYDVSSLSGLTQLAAGESLTDIVTYRIADSNAGTDDNAASVSTFTHSTDAPQVTTIVFSDPVSPGQEMTLDIAGVGSVTHIIPPLDGTEQDFLNTFAFEILGDAVLGAAVSPSVSDSPLTLTLTSLDGAFSPTFTWEDSGDQPITGFVLTNTPGTVAGTQVDTVTIAGTHGSGEAGDTYTVEVDGNSLTYTVTGSESGLGGVRDAMIDAINADAAISAIVTASAGSGSNDIDLTGVTSATTFTTTASAFNTGTATGTATVTVGGVNDDPTANADSYSASSNLILSVDAASGLLANDTDPDTSDVLRVRVDESGYFDVNDNQTLDSGEAIREGIAGDGTDTSLLDNVALTEKGAKVTFNEDGSFTYDPRGATELFVYQSADEIPTDSGEPGFGSQVGDQIPVDGTAQDSFSYTLFDPQNVEKIHTVTLTVQIVGGRVEITDTDVTISLQDGLTDEIIGDAQDNVVNVSLTGAINTGDSVVFEEGDFMDGGAGNDTLILANSGNIIRVENVENVFGGAGVDVITVAGTVGAKVEGGGGDDVLKGGDGNDVLDGGVGNDLLIGGTGLGDDTYIGGEGIDTISYASAPVGQDLVINLAEGIAFDVNSGSPWIGNDTLIGIENVISGAGNDHITGDAADNTITGGGGNDVMDGGAGNDVLVGASGDDTFVMSTGNDLITAGGGTDSLTADSRFVIENAERTDTGDVIITARDDIGRETTVTIQDFFNDPVSTFTFYDEGVQKTIDLSSLLDGSALSNATGLAGGAADETITGGSGDDYIFGNDGDDVLEGGEGADFLSGGAGNDTLDGGIGDDDMVGGIGDDLFIASAGDDHIIAGDTDIAQLEDLIATLTSTKATADSTAANDAAAAISAQNQADADALAVTTAQTQADTDAAARDAQQVVVDQLQIDRDAAEAVYIADDAAASLAESDAAAAQSAADADPGNQALQDAADAANALAVSLRATADASGATFMALDTSLSNESSILSSLISAASSSASAVISAQIGAELSAAAAVAAAEQADESAAFAAEVDASLTANQARLAAALAGNGGTDTLEIGPEFELQGVVSDPTDGSVTVTIEDRDTHEISTITIEDQDLDPVEFVRFDEDGDGDLETYALATGLTAADDQDTVIAGTDGDDVIYGGGGGDILFGNAGDDTLFGDTQLSAELIQNGDFESGDLSHWTVSDLLGSSGSFFIDDNDGSTPLSTLATGGPAGGSYYAISDQTAPGTHALSQAFSVTAGSGSVVLSFDMFVNDFSGDGPIVDTAGLDHNAVPNQHARVDILRAGATDFATDAGSVLSSLFIGVDTGTIPNPYTSYQFDITDVVSGGGDFILRFAETDNQGNFNQGVDNVSIALDNVSVQLTAGDDVLIGGDGNDNLVGGGGDDLLRGGAGSDTIDGGDGTDTVDYSDGELGVTVSLADGNSVGAPAVAVEQALGAVEEGSASNEGGLLNLNTGTGAGTLIADAATPGGLSGLDSTNDSRLFATKTVGGESFLVQLDPVTGAELSSIEIVDDLDGNIDVVDLAIRPSDNAIYVIDDVGQIWTVVEGTGVATALNAPTGYDEGSGSSPVGGGIAFASDSTLYGIGRQSNLHSVISLINADGSFGSHHTISPAVTGNFSGLGIRSDGQMFATIEGTDTLYTLSWASNGATTVVGNSGAGNVDDVAFLTFAATQSLGSDLLSNIENVIGTDFNDSIVGDNNNNVLDGGEGDDLLQGDAAGSSSSVTTAESSPTVAQVSTVTIAGVVEVGDEYSVTVDGITVSVTIASPTDLDGVAALLVTEINGHGTLGPLVTAAPGGTGELTITANAPGGSFSATAASVDHGSDNTNDASALVTTTAQAGEGQVDLLTIDGDFSIDNEVVVTINGEDVVVPVDGGEGGPTLRNEVMNAINNADIGPFTATAGTGDYEIILTGAPGVSFISQVSVGGEGGDDILRGGAGNDTLDGGVGINMLDGGAGNDVITGGTRGDNARDFNTVDYRDATAAIDVDLSVDGTAAAAGTADAGIGTDTLLNIDRVLGSDFDDTFTVDEFWSGSQYDSFGGGVTGQFMEIEGGGGDDTITGHGFLRVGYRYADAGVTVTIDDSGAGTATSATTVDAGIGTDTFTGVNGVRGSNFDDTITGGAGSETIRGQAGDDVLDGGGGFDRLDYLNSATGVVVNFSATTETLSGLNVGAGQASDGFGGIDTFSNFEAVRGSGNDDILIGSDGDDNIRGEGGDDLIVTGGASFSNGDWIRGGAGSDTIDFGTGQGFYTIDYRHLDGSIEVDLTQATNQITKDTVGDGLADSADTLVGDENISNFGGLSIRDTDGDDVFVGPSGSSSLTSYRLLGGNDTVTGGDGEDRVDYRDAAAGVSVNLDGTPTDVVVGSGSGSMTFSDSEGSPTQTVTADPGTFFDGNGDPFAVGAEIVFTGGLNTTIVVDSISADGSVVTFTGSNFGITTSVSFSATVTVSGGTATSAGTFDAGIGNDVLLGSIEQVRGSDFDDSLIGNDLDNQLRGRGGDDFLDGGAGSDWARFSGASESVIADLGTDNQTTSVTVSDGFGGTDTLSNIENLRGGSHDDQLFGDLGANILRAGDGDDILDGRAGDDQLRGEDGDDTLTGGFGTDELRGGEGSDIFRLTSVSDSITGAGDVITDFDALDDNEKISIEGFQVGNFTFNDTGTLSGSNNTEAIFDDTSKLLTIDVDGDGTGDMELTLLNVDGGNLDINDFAATTFPNIAVRDAVVDENAGTVQVAVVRTAQPGSDLNFQSKVHVQSADGTAISGSDYTGGGVTLTFEPGDSQINVIFDLLDDNLSEGLENFFVNLSAPENAFISDAQAQVDIVDSEPRILGVSGSGGRLQFDGVDDFVDAGRDGDGNLAITGDLTVEAWFKPGESTGVVSLVSFNAAGPDTDSANNGLYEIALNLGEGEVRLDHESGNGENQGQTLFGDFSTNDWNHIAAVRDASAKTWTLYTNGSEIGSFSYTANAEGGENGSLNIGRLRDGEEYFRGEIDEVRVWSEVRTAGEIEDAYERQFDDAEIATLPNLVGYWEFDSVEHAADDSLVVENLVSDGPGATLGDGTNFDTEPLLLGNNTLAGLNFSGSGDFLEAGFQAGLITDEVTLELNARFDSLTGQQTLMRLGTNGSDDPHFTAYKAVDNTLHFVFNDDGDTGTDIATGFTMAADTWYHLGFVYDGDQATVTVNGDEVASTELSGFSLGTGGSQLTIGAGQGGAEGFDGTLSDVRVWSIPRDTEDIHDDLSGFVPSDSANLAGNWRLDEGTDTLPTQALTFASNNSANKIELPAGAFNFADNEPFTIEYWMDTAYGDFFHIDNGTNYKLGTANSGSGISPPGLRAIANSDAANFNPGPPGITGDQSWDSSNTDEWNHIAWVYDGTNMSVYQDGTRIQIGAWDPGTANTAPLVLSGSVRHHMDDLRIWNVARTQTEITDNADATFPPGDQGGTLIAHYTFNDVTTGADGSSIIDISGNGHHGTVVGTVTTETTDLPTNLVDTNVVVVADAASGNTAVVIGEPDAVETGAPLFTTNTTTNEDAAIRGTVGALDTDVDDFTFTITGQPDNGTVTIDVETGEYVYTPSEDTNAEQNGTDNFTVEVTEVLSGGALDFDGVDDYVDAGTLDLQQDAFTVEMWMNADSSGDWPYLFELGGLPNEDLGRGLRLQLASGEGSLFIVTDDGTTQAIVDESSTGWTYNNWHHVAVTYDGSNITAYVDGNLAGSASTAALGSIVDSDGQVAIGRSERTASPNDQFDGSITDVRVWDHARTQGEIQADKDGRLNGDETGLLRYWALDGNSNSTVTDLTGNSPAGTINGATPVPDQPAALDQGATTTQTITVEVAAVNDAPDADNKPSESTAEDTDLVITLSASDQENDPLGFFTIETLPTNGRLFFDDGEGGRGAEITQADTRVPAVDGSANVVFAPDQDYNGPDTFTYTATDLLPVEVNLPGGGVSVAGPGVGDAGGYTFAGNNVKNVSAAGDVDNDGNQDFLTTTDGETVILGFGGADSLDAVANPTNDDPDNAVQTFINTNDLTDATHGFEFSLGANYQIHDVANAGDVNGDGFDDLLIAGGYHTNSSTYGGAVYLVFGGATHLNALDGAVQDGQIDLTQLTSLNTTAGEHGYRVQSDLLDDSAANSGRYSVSGAGDVNGDGFDDILISHGYLRAHSTSSIGGD